MDNVWKTFKKMWLKVVAKWMSSVYTYHTEAKEWRRGRKGWGANLKN